MISPKPTVCYGQENGWAIREGMILGGQEITKQNSENGFLSDILNSYRNSRDIIFNRSKMLQAVNDNIPAIDFLNSDKGLLLSKPTSVNLITRPITLINRADWNTTDLQICADDTTEGATDLVAGWNLTTWANDDITAQSLNSFSTSGNGGKWNTGIVPANKRLRLKIAGSISAGKLNIYNAGTSGTSNQLNRNHELTGNFSATIDFFSNTDDWYFNTTVAADVTITQFEVYEIDGFLAPAVNANNIQYRDKFYLKEGTGTGNHFANILNNLSITSSSDYTATFLAEPNGRNIEFRDRTVLGINSRVQFILSENGDIANTGPSVKHASIKYIPEIGMYLCQCTITTDGSQTLFKPELRLLDVQNDNYTGNGTSGVYVYNIVLENLSWSSGFFIVDSELEGAAQSRAGNIPSQAHISPKTNNTSVTLFWRGIMRDYNGLGGRISLSDGTADNRVTIGMLSNNNIVVSIIKSAVSEYDRRDITSNFNSLIGIAVRCEENNLAVSVNGSIIYTSNSNPAFTASFLNYLQFAVGANSAPMYADTENTGWYDYGLDNNQLNQISNID